MDNNELFLKFTQISEYTNTFDVFEKLKELNKQYKKSTFYKNTHMKISKAYELFIVGQLKNIIVHINKLTDVAYLSDFISDVISGVDIDTLNGFADKIINVLDISQLKTLQGDLSKSLNKMKSI